MRYLLAILALSGCGTPTEPACRDLVLVNDLATADSTLVALAVTVCGP